MSPVHQFCVRPTDGSTVIAVWASDSAIHIDLVRWLVATRLEYALRTGHCTVDDHDPRGCGGTPIYHLDARGSAITYETLRELAGTSCGEMIAAIMTIQVVQVAKGSDPTWDTRVAEPVPDHASAAHAALKKIWERIR